MCSDWSTGRQSVIDPMAGTKTLFFPESSNTPPIHPFHRSPLLALIDVVRRIAMHPCIQDTHDPFF